MRTEVYLHEKSYLGTKSIDILILNGYISNNYFLYKIKTKIKVFPNFFLDTYSLIIFFSKKFPNLKNHIAMREDQQKDFYQLLDKKKVFFDITKDEIKKGKEILEQNTKKNYKGIVLLCVRNQDYNKKYFKDGNWDYLDYRNYNLDDFLAGANFLAENNYLVLRMGKFNSNKVHFKNNNIVDYSNENWRSDFMDYYLGYACDFCITTHTGMDCFARLFRKPFGAVVNPIEDLFYFQKNWTQIFGSFKNKENNKVLSLDEIYFYNLHKIATLQNLDNSKFEIIKNNSNEILELVKEVKINFENKVIKSSNALEYDFWRKFDKNIIKKNKYLDSGYPDTIQANIGASFLNKNIDIFDQK